MKFIFRCNNHEEKTPSLSVDVKKGEFYCMSCGHNGVIVEDQSRLMLVIEHLKNMVNHFEGFLE